MYKPALHDSCNLKNAIGLMKYKVEFRREHPYYFDPIGTAIFCGAQGSGKTLSGVNYVYNVLKDYPYAVLVTNVAMRIIRTMRVISLQMMARRTCTI